MKRNKLSYVGVLIVLIAFIIFSFTSCEGSKPPAKSADTVMSQQTNTAMKEAVAQVGYPAIVNYQEMKWAKMIFELRDKIDLITYAYIVNMNGELIFLGKCIGYGLPYSVQYTSPQKIWDLEVDGGGRDKYEDNGEIQVLPQADPNGLFMPDGLSATWLLLINPETGEPQPIYVEPEILVSPFPLHNMEP